MKKLVVDASVAVKWFVPEIHSEAAARLLDSGIVFSAPDLIIPELGNVLWKKLRRNEITRRDASEVLAAFEALDLDLHPSSVIFPSAMELAIALDRSVYDSLYLALAVAQDCQLITADRKFYSAMSASSLASHARWIENER